MKIKLVCLKKSYQIYLLENNLHLEFLYHEFLLLKVLKVNKLVKKNTKAK